MVAQATLLDNVGWHRTMLEDLPCEEATAKDGVVLCLNTTPTAGTHVEVNKMEMETNSYLLPFLQVLVSLLILLALLLLVYYPYTSHVL